MRRERARECYKKARIRLLVSLACAHLACRPRPCTLAGSAPGSAAPAWRPAARQRRIQSRSACPDGCSSIIYTRAREVGSTAEHEAGNAARVRVPALTARAWRRAVGLLATARPTSGKAVLDSQEDMRSAARGAGSRLGSRVPARTNLAGDPQNMKVRAGAGAAERPHSSSQPGCDRMFLRTQGFVLQMLTCQGRKEQRSHPPPGLLTAAAYWS